jgi:hypothetical protein
MAVYDTNAAKGKVTDYATKKYGRGPANDDEWAAIGQGINYEDGVDDNELNQAYGNTDTYASSIGATVLPGYQAEGTGGAAATGSGGGSWQEYQNFLTNNPGDGGRYASAHGYDQGAVDAMVAAGAPAANEDGSVDASTTTTTTGGIPPGLADLIPGLFGESTPSPLDTQVQEALQALLTRSQQPVSITDPQLQPASDTFRASQQRGAERMRSAMAERAAQTGQLESGGFDTEALGYQQNANFASAQRDSELVLGEMESRREDLKTGLTLAMASGQFDKQQALKQQLALLDAAIEKERINVTGTLGQGDLDLRELLGLGGLSNQSRGLDIQELLGQGDIDLRSLLGQGNLGLGLLSLLIGNDNFYSGLGMQGGINEAGLNQNAIIQLLNGLGN